MLAGGLLGLRAEVVGHRGEPAELAGVCVVERSVASGPLVSVSYALADAGRGLVPALELLAGWARERLGLKPERAASGT